MKKTGLFASAALTAVNNIPITAGAITEQQKQAPALPLHAKFRGHLKCPYAEKWLTKGPEQAAKELGLDQHGRKLQVSMGDAQGSCSYPNAFSGGVTCMQFNGAGWTDDDMQSRCAQENGSTFSTDGCASATAGWCTKMVSEDKHEATAMDISPMADCDGNKMACGTFMGGTFVADNECLAASSSSEENIFMSGGGPPPGVDISGGAGTSYPGAADSAATTGECLIAPGAIGAAHQAGFSQGYSNSCPNTPGQESKYMWPLKWSAETENHAMAYGSDDIVYHSKAKVYYMLDRNWKRLDMTYEQGVLRSLGQGLCGDDRLSEQLEGGADFSCAKNSTEVTTMIHRGGEMWFFDWKTDPETNEPMVTETGELDASKISECTKFNLAVIGNIRPDWFMDKRGDDTDVQYLGDQHVYHADGQIPKLVKQWRKKDFASQYFTMSMMGNPANKLKQDPEAPIEDNIHWPLILNIPGEGFGDDQLQVYRNHELLSDEDEELFTLVERYEALGGVCTDVMGGTGPPTGDEENHIPSNLEVDPLSWVSKEVTFSPIWVSSDSLASPAEVESPPTYGKSVLSVSDRLTVEYCYDESSQMADISIHFHDVEVDSSGLLPWMAVGYRDYDVCAMNNPDGGDTPLVMLTHSSEDVLPVAHTTMLPPEAKRFSPDAFASMTDMLKPLADNEEYDSVSVDAPMVTSEMQIARSSSPLTTEDTVSLHFKQKVETSSSMKLMYAIGGSQDFGFHMTRGCFEVPEPTPCGGSGQRNDQMDTVNLNVDLSDSSSKEDHKSSSACTASAGFLFALLPAAVSLATLAGM